MSKLNHSLRKRQASFLASGFWRGTGGLFEFCKALARYNLSTSGANADYNALYSDWEAVGSYLRHAMSEYSTGAGMPLEMIENEEECQKKTNKIKSSQA